MQDGIISNTIKAAAIQLKAHTAHLGARFGLGDGSNGVGPNVTY